MIFDVLFPSAHAAVYSVSTGALTDIAQGASDTADSGIGVLADMFPILVPLLVFGLVYGVVRKHL